MPQMAICEKGNSLASTIRLAKRLGYKASLQRDPLALWADSGPHVSGCLEIQA